MKTPTHHLNRQTGASLIEVLVAILLLSFGMLALGAMMSFAVQAPKLSGYRAVATNLATGFIGRIRANPHGFETNLYTSSLSYDGTFDAISLANCTYPNCTEATLATMDIAVARQAARQELPAGGMILKCEGGACAANSYGNLWIVWQEPGSFDTNPFGSSDNCPTEVTGTYTSPKPRCLYVRFSI